jgi:integrase/recombinase XerC
MSANVFKIGQIWHFRFQVNGQRVQRSTRLRNRARAETFAQAAFDNAVVAANGGKPVPTLDELIGAWLAVHLPTASTAHISSVETFRKLHMYQLADLKVCDIGTEQVEAARNEHLQGRRPATANHWLRILKLLTLWAVKREILAKSPWKVSMIKVQKRPRPVLPLDIAKAWFEAVDNASTRTPGVGMAVRLMFGLGLRESESASARWEWIDWQRGTYTPGITKGREAEPIPVPAWLRAELEAVKREEGLIAARNDGRQFEPGFARSAMRSANATCSIKGITPHRLRGTFATLLSETGVPIQTIQKVMRHKSFTTTMGYLEKNLDTAAKAQNEIGSIIGFARRKTGEHITTAADKTGNAND